MKSPQSGSALAALCLLCLSSTASAQFVPYGPTMLQDVRRPVPTVYAPTAYVPTAQYFGAGPTTTSAPPLTAPAYSGYNNLSSLSEIIGAPPPTTTIGGPYQYPHGLHNYTQPMPPSYGATSFGSSAYGCGGCGSCDSCFGPALGNGHGNWFGSVSALLMKPDRANPYYFSYDRDNEAHQLTNTQDAEIQWGGGFDIRFGRYFNCGRNGVEVVYWGLFPSTEITSATADDVSLGNLDAILNWSDLIYNGFDANAWTDGAEIHQLWHEHAYHNVEINLLSFCGACGASGSCSSCTKGGGKCNGVTGGSCRDSRMRNRYLLGVRWFKFHDNLLFGADTFDRQFTFDPSEIYYNVDLDNNLIGFQFGCEGEYCINTCWTFDYGIKLGIYGNHISHTSEIGGAAGVATIDGGPNDGVEFFVDNSKDDVAVLGEANVGLEYRFLKCWTATLGYRALAVTGVALPTNQIWHDLRGIQDVVQVDSNGSLILHGGYFGAEYNY